MGREKKRCINVFPQDILVKWNSSKLRQRYGLVSQRLFPKRITLIPLISMLTDYVTDNEVSIRGTLEVEARNGKTRDWEIFF